MMNTEENIVETYRTWRTKKYRYQYKMILLIKNTNYAVIIILNTSTQRYHQFYLRIKAKNQKKLKKLKNKLPA